MIFGQDLNDLNADHFPYCWNFLYFLTQPRPLMALILMSNSDSLDIKTDLFDLKSWRRTV